VSLRVTRHLDLHLAILTGCLRLPSSLYDASPRILKRHPAAWSFSSRPDPLPHSHPPSQTMELGLTFGAVGDLISIAILIKDSVSAFDDSRGSSKAYSDLVGSLNVID